jgi:hypothetical protein
MTLLVPTQVPSTPAEIAPPQPDFTVPPAPPEPTVAPLGCPGGTVVICYQWAQRQNQGTPGSDSRNAYCDRLATAIAGTSDYTRRLNVYNACVS